ANYTHRHKQGAQDLFNILLNMGYATIRGYTTSFLSASGLAPSIGMLHKARGNHMALSSDLMEPFRYIVERVATTLLKRNIINHTHLEEKQGEIKLNAGGRRLFYTALSNQLETKRQPKYGGQKQTIIQHMQTQSNSLSHWVHSQEKTFNVWRMH
ncbi:MAG: CRISPR-associated endonuclease Cas1, partial [Cycloclasticus sp.]|nr:CRISPR-associated endonuclease Cas1 [Cycloclasticus sp.]